MTNKYGKSEDQKLVEEALEKAGAIWTEEGWVCEGDLNLSKLGIVSLPMIKTVEGDFYCQYNQLKTLAGSPETVGGDFSCENNKLETLVGSPKIVGGGFYCDHNQLESLECAPKIVRSSFYCDFNQLKTLVGSPKIIGCDLSFHHNMLKSLNGSPEVVGGDLSCYNNQLETLAGSPEVVGGHFSCFNNELKTLDGSPKRIGGDLSCGHNRLQTLNGAPKMVGGGFYCRKNPLRSLGGAPKEKVDQGNLILWPDGKYASIDGIFGEIIKKHNDVWKMRKILGKEYYVVNDGNGNYAHGDSIKEAKEDLLFKICKRNKDDYKSLTLESVLKHDEAVICYRVITGACRPGVKDFIENSLKEEKEEYSVKEIIELTNRKYGNHNFMEFFDPSDS